MSATLRITDFTENRALFPRGPPPVVRVGGRQHPVRTYMLDRPRPLPVLSGVPCSRSNVSLAPS